jgi:hypothetical protein
MCGAGEDGQLRRRDTAEVAVDVAAAQLQESDGVLERDRVAVADGDQGRRAISLTWSSDQPEKPSSYVPSLSSRSCSLSGFGDLAR